MNCYVCFRLKAEARISVVQSASLTINGYSVCDRHAFCPGNSDTMLRNLEVERDALRRWWEAAIKEHGEWDHARQRFADRSTLEAAAFPLGSEPRDSGPTDG